MVWKAMIDSAMPVKGECLLGFFLSCFVRRGSKDGGQTWGREDWSGGGWALAANGAESAFSLFLSYIIA